MRISDWSSDVCSSNLSELGVAEIHLGADRLDEHRQQLAVDEVDRADDEQHHQRDVAAQRESAVGRYGASFEGSRLCHHTLQKRTSLPVAKILRYISLSVNVLYGNRIIDGREGHGNQIGRAAGRERVC